MTHAGAAAEVGSLLREGSLRVLFGISLAYAGYCDEKLLEPQLLSAEGNNVIIVVALITYCIQFDSTTP